MRNYLLLVGLLATLSTVSAGKPIHRTIAQIVESDRWSVAEGTHAEKPLLVRFREGFQSKPDVSAYPYLVRVVWSYDADASGMPDALQSDSMSLFEDRLITAVEPNYTAVLTAVITNAGQREWLFYTSSVPEFGRLLTEMPQEKERYPIDIASESDPEWAALHEDILGGVAR